MTRFVLKVETKSGQAGIHALRWFLKSLGRRGLRVIDAREEHQPDVSAHGGGGLKARSNGQT